MDIKSFLISRIPRVPPKESRQKAGNPFKIVAQLTPMQHALFWSGWLAWFADSFDFFCISLSIIALGEEFNQSDSSITTAITLTLLLRSLGAFSFGLLADRFGRKWPLIGVLCIITVFQIAAGFVKSFSQLLAIRSLFGICMGGVWGLGTATAMENMPPTSRGIYSGVMNTGYPTGYLIATVVNLFLVPKYDENWRCLFWTGAGISFFAAFIRLLLPETNKMSEALEDDVTAGKRTKVFLSQFKVMIKTYWPRFFVGLFLMTGMNFLSHGSQDLYPTFMQRSKGFTRSQANLANIIGEVSAVVSSVIGGYISQLLGRRLTMLVSLVWTGAFIPLWVIPSSWGGLVGGAFMVQIGVNACWGVIAIYLNEISPPAFRGLYPGTIYQLGNMVSSAAAQIEATAGSHLRIVVDGRDQPDYGAVQAILLACVVVFLILCVLGSPENYGANFEDAKTALEEGGGRGESQHNDPRSGSSSLDEQQREYDNGDNKYNKV